MNQYCVDANVFITAWHSLYHVNIFPSLWKQLAASRDEIIIIKPVYDEIEPISSSDSKIGIIQKREKYPVRMWLEENQFVETPINDDVNILSLDLEKMYEIHDTSKGAGQTDITLISFSKISKKTVVTLESEQKQKPKEKYNYKIPLICDEQGVECINFIEMLTKLFIRI